MGDGAKVLYKLCACHADAMVGDTDGVLVLDCDGLAVRACEVVGVVVREREGALGVELHLLRVAAAVQVEVLYETTGNPALQERAKV